MGKEAAAVVSIGIGRGSRRCCTVGGGACEAEKGWLYFTKLRPSPMPFTRFFITLPSPSPMPITLRRVKA